MFKLCNIVNSFLSQRLENGERGVPIALRTANDLVSLSIVYV